MTTIRTYNNDGKGSNQSLTVLAYSGIKHWECTAGEIPTEMIEYFLLVGLLQAIFSTLKF